MPDLLVQYGVAILFGWAFAVQAGLPLPAAPVLLGAGALSGSGRMNLALAVGATMVAALGADVLWYALGRSLGLRVFGALCRFSLDPTLSSGTPRSDSSPIAEGIWSWPSFCRV